MSDSPTFYSPTPGMFSQGNTGDDAFRATLASHTAASVERNQDAQFSAAFATSSFIGTCWTRGSMPSGASRNSGSARCRAPRRAPCRTGCHSRREGLSREVAGLRDARATDLLTQVLQAVKK